MTQNQRFCPNCGSENVEPDTRRTNVLGEMIFDQNKWVCNDCGYTGIMPSGDPEQDFDKDEEIEFENADEEGIDTDAGKGYLKYELYILIPLTVLYLLILAARS
ncbi:MAG: hypothetical protein ABEK10_03670 [Candidatus Nanosalina sp.]